MKEIQVNATSLFWRIPFDVLSIFMLVIASVHSADACSCGRPGPPLEELGRNEAVFSGRVIEIAEPVSPWGENLTITFAVTAVWKGEIEQTVTVTTAPDDARCGYPFTLCEDYLVYAHSFDGAVANVGLCGRTTPLSDAGDDVMELGNPAVEWPVIDLSTCGDLNPLWGKWKIEVDAPYMEWDIIEFRPDGTCTANTQHVDDSFVVVQFPYAKERTLMFGEEAREKVVLGDSQYLFVNSGDGWQRRDNVWFPNAFFVLSQVGQLTAYPNGEANWLDQPAVFSRTDQAVLSVSTDGTVTSVLPVGWSRVKAAIATQ